MPHPHRPPRDEAASPLVDEPGDLPVEPDRGPVAPEPLPAEPDGGERIPDVPQ